MIRIPLLPHWVLTNKLPAFYDYESMTAVEQTARLYGVMQSMITDYNNFATDFNKTFNDYVNEINQDQECFQNSITKIVHDYIAMLDEKLKMQDKEITDAVKYMKDNLSTSITQVISEMKELGELDQAILDSIDGIGTRVTTLETQLSTLDETVLKEINENINPDIVLLKETDQTLLQNIQVNSNRITVLENPIQTIERTLSSFTEVTGEENSLIYNKTTKQCTLSFSVTGSILTDGTSTTIMQIPTGYRPTNKVYGNVILNVPLGGFYYGYVYVSSDGNVNVIPINATDVDTLQFARGQISWYVE